jgi:dihydroneopterin aldolase
MPNGSAPVTFEVSASPVAHYAIKLRGIRFRAKHGVSKSERQLFQDFLVDVELDLPAALLPVKDRIDESFNYDRIAALVVAEGTAESYRLLETVASRVIQRLLRDTKALRVVVSVGKTNPPTGASVEQAMVTLVATAAVATASVQKDK